jgi:hypothetical protein
MRFGRDNLDQRSGSVKHQPKINALQDILVFIQLTANGSRHIKHKDILISSVITLVQSLKYPLRLDIQSTETGKVMGDIIVRQSRRDIR